jgi:squalene-hopene/tetraprenyl-beta-curcumene cyclase
MKAAAAPVFLASVMALSGGCGPGGVATPAPPTSEAPSAHDAGVRYLLGRQDADGAWRSEVYGHFRSGDALTPLVLSALLESGRQEARDPCRRAADYLARLALPGKEDEPVELSYPSYTAALAASALSRGEFENERHRKARDACLALVRRLQLAEEGGWPPDDVEYGGWGYSSGPPRKPRAGEPASPLAEANLSATVFALEALRAAGIATDDPAIRRGLIFVRRCQNFHADGKASKPSLDDGGFFFLHHDFERNKAGLADGGMTPRFRSYGSTTADGLRCLLACGLTKDDPAVRAAIGWLERNFSADHHPGDFAPGTEPRRDALYFYYAASVSRALHTAGVDTPKTSSDPVRWADALAAELARCQRADGSWSNPANSMREDDQILATSWAVTALSLCGRAGGR